MCGSTTLLAKGRAWTPPPVGYPLLMVMFRPYRHSQHHDNAWPLYHHSREPSRSPENPMTSSLRQLHWDKFFETMPLRPTLRGLDTRQPHRSWITTKGDVVSPLDPIEQSLKNDLNPKHTMINPALKLPW